MNQHISTTNIFESVSILVGTACNGNVTDGTSYTCSDVTISYNTMYTVSVTSLEPCFNRVGAVANTSKVSGMSSLPAAPSGLGYTFSEDYLTLTWTPPLCTPLNGPTGYRVVVRRCVYGASVSLLMFRANFPYLDCEHKMFEFLISTVYFVYID